MAEEPSTSAMPPLHQPVSNQSPTVATVVETGPATSTIGVKQHTSYSEDKESIIKKPNKRFITSNENMGSRNAVNSFSGFLDILYELTKLPGSFIKNIIYKLGLLIYYFVNFAYSIVALAVHKQFIAYHIVYVSICLIGLIFELIAITVDVKRCLTQSNSNSVEDNTPIMSYQVGPMDQPKEGWTAKDERVPRQDYCYKAKCILLNYVISSLGELLIYPTLICVMYGFINERSWEFDNGTSTCIFILLVYSVIMDALYMKFHVILFMVRLICVSYTKYDALVQPTNVEWKRYFTPVYLSILFAITTALTHWLMTAIIGVRIYVDNFIPEIHGTNSSVNSTDTNSNIPDTGDYRVTLFTGYMIACTIYLPIVSWITYITLNKLWFYEVYSAISQLSSGADSMPEEDTWDEKLFVFIKDYRHTLYNRLSSYAADVFLLIPFTVFSVGSYLPDYDSSEYEVASSARDTIQELATPFIVLFLLSNIQAVISFIIITIFFIILLLCGLPIVFWKVLP